MITVVPAHRCLKLRISQRILDKKVSLQFHFIKKTESVTTLKRQATRLLCDLRDACVPVLITEHGDPAACRADVDSHEFMQKKMQIPESTARGEQKMVTVSPGP